MNLKTKLVSGLVLGAVAMAGTSMAEEVKAKKEAPTAFKSVLPNLYMIGQLRHYTTEMTSGGVSPMMQVRSYIGSSFMDGDLDISFTLKGTKRPASNQVSNSPVELYVSHNSFSSKFLNVGTYVWSKLPHGGKTSLVVPGIDLSTAHKFDNSIASITPILGVDTSMTLSGDESQAVVQGLKPNEGKEFGLTADSNGVSKTDQEGIPYSVAPRVALSIKPKFAKKVSVYMEAKGSFDYDPVMAKTTIDGEERIAHTGFDESRSSYDRLKVSYRLNDSTSLSNDFYYNHNDIYEGDSAGARFTNILYVSKTFL